MTDVIPIEPSEKRQAIDVYNELTLKLGHYRSMATLLSCVCLENVTEREINTVGYALEGMFDDLSERVSDLFDRGS